MVTATVDRRLEQALEFVRSELSLPDGRRLREVLPSDPWIEREILAPVLAQDAEGLPLHRLYLAELSRGQAKTFNLANCAITEAARGGGTEIIGIAADFDQAALLGQAVSGQLRRNPALGRLFRQSKAEFTCKPTGSRIRIMSSDAPSFYGVGVDAQRLRIYADEISQWQSAGLFEAAISTLPKLRDAQLACISNAGVRGHWWEDIRFGAEANGWYVYSKPGVIATWVRAEDLEAVRGTLPPAIYSRYFENVWVDPEGQFASLDDWDRCQVAELQPPSPQAYYFAGVDAGIKSDHFGICVVSRNWEHPQDGVSVQDIAEWVPTPGHPVDLAEPEAWLRAYALAHPRLCVVYDKFALEFMMQRLSRVMWTIEFSQQDARAVADTSLYTAIMASRVAHRGEPALRQALNNAVLRVSAGAVSKGRIDKRTEAGKVDLLVALSMASYQCLESYADP